MKLHDITDFIEKLAPVQSQESYDNSGLLVGNKDDLIRGALITLDITEEVIDEAIALDYNLIISHHPLIFKPIKKINGTNVVERCLIKAIKHGIALYAAHTNLDNSYTGVNAILAEKIGLADKAILQPVVGALVKYVVFVPVTHQKAVMEAIFNAGAGVIGDYDCCSFNTEGEGTFRALDGSNPFVGERGEFHTEPEVRIETIMPDWLRYKVLKRVKEVHPYEEIAWDIYPLKNEFARLGAGMYGTLPEPISESDFLRSLKNILNVPFLKHSPFLNRKVMKVGLCGGSGNFLINDAISAGCDVFITGELKYHDYFLADNKIMLIEAGHYETEQFSKELLYTKLKEKFTTFALQISGIISNPVMYL